METRSQRRLAQEQSQLQQQQHHRPAYPQLQTTQSTPASAFQSSSSLASVTSLNMNNPAHNAQHHLRTQQPGFASAPLPSPSAAHQPSAGYFNTAAPTSHPAQQARIPPQMQGGFVGQRGGDSGGAPETAPFLQDFSLVAEAAKRAQMACLARDLGDVGL